MEQKNNYSIERKTEFAFCAMMFFAPLVKKNVRESKVLSQEEKKFVSWFIKLWYVNIMLLIIAIALWVVWYITNNSLIQKISIWFLILLSISLIVWTILAALNKSIWSNADFENLEWKADFDKIFYFIPIYNIYIWYKKHQFEWENSTIKCSILLLILFTLSAIFIRNPFVNVSILIFVLFVVVCSINWVTFWSRWVNILNKSFLKNPEEIWWYISWPIFFLFNKLFKADERWIKENIDEQKKQFEFLFKIDNKQIIFEYVFMCLLCVLGIFVWIKYLEYSLLTGIALIVLRYAVMAIKWKHLPHLPVFRWISSIFFRSKIIKDE